MLGKLQKGQIGEVAIVSSKVKASKPKNSAEVLAIEVKTSTSKITTEELASLGNTLIKRQQSELRSNLIMGPDKRCQRQSFIGRYPGSIAY